MTPRKPSKSSPFTENPDSSRTPRPKSSEIGDPMRRSFSGNPFQKPSIVANPRGFNPVTPANSPSDWIVRGRESNTMRFLRESEEKENSRDSNNQKLPAAKSPSITNSKGMKNFMSPTISAASKINASPNKKILTERNSHDQQPPLRSSVASLDLRSSCSSISNVSETMEESETSFDKELDLKGAVLDPTVGTEDSLLESNDIVEDMKPSFPSALEPIDADHLSLMSPYDPKTNFLAPRPKFLYYKPKEMDCNPLDGDEGLFSDSFSESEATEETESDISQNEDAVSSQVLGSKEEEEELGAADTEPNLHQSPRIEKKAVAVAVTEKERSRQHLFTRSKCIVSAFILFLIACSTMMEPDHLQIARSCNSMFKESSFPLTLEVVSKKTEYLRSSVERNIRLWCDFSMSYAGALMSELRGEHQLGHVSFFNLTNLEKTQWNGKKMENLIQDADSEIIIEQNVQIEAEEKEESDIDSRIEGEVEMDVVDESPEYDEISSIEFELDDDENSACTEDEEVKLVEEEAVQGIAAEEEEEDVIAVEVEEEKRILEEPELVTIQSGEVEVEEEQKVIWSVEKENILEEEVEESEVVVAAEKETELPRVEELVPTDIKIVSQDSAEVPESIESSSNRMTQIAALSSLILSLVAGCVAFKKTRSSMVVVSSNAEQAEEEEEEEHIMGAAKKFNISPVSGNNNLMAKFDFVGDSSWPSTKRSGDLNTGKSSSRRRRESVAAAAAASSSSDDMSMGGSASPSLSYGSFTTYEMIPTKKKRNGDEEDLVITPLRRSSRLRK